MERSPYKIEIALYRPAINSWGIPHKSWQILFMGTMLFAMWFGEGAPWYYLAGIPFFLALRALTEWDHNFLRIFLLWRKTKGQSIIFNILNGRPPWGGSLLSSCPCGISKNHKDLAGAV